MKIIDTNLNEHVEVLKMVLLYSDELSLLPDIYDIFGNELMVKFLDLFSGTTITVPSSKDLAKSVRDVTVYIKVKQVTGSHRAVVIKELAKEFELTEDMIRSTFRVVAEIVEDKHKFKLIMDNIKKENE